jgi:hypothetical protein
MASNKWGQVLFCNILRPSFLCLGLPGFDRAARLVKQIAKISSRTRKYVVRSSGIYY